jgi:hypothetical protein
MGRLIQVHTAPSATEGHLARARLESEGIPVFTKGEGDGPYRMGPLHLWVDEALEVQARMVLDVVLGGELALEADEDVEPVDRAD